MVSRIVTRAIVSLLGLTGSLFFPPSQFAQRPENNATAKSFVGNWKGICADGAEFIVLKLSESDHAVAGTISIANMHGGTGECEAVIDPPTDEHAMKIHDAHLQETTLTFKGAGQTAFEMVLLSDGEATLKFLGTPVEKNPWKLQRAK